MTVDLGGLCLVHGHLGRRSAPSGCIAFGVGLWQGSKLGLRRLLKSRIRDRPKTSTFRRRVRSCQVEVGVFDKSWFSYLP